MQRNVVKLETGRTEDKLKFVELRAKGFSYNKIAKELNVSKATLTAWNEELKGHIAALKAEHLRELYTSYGMFKEARIKALGDILLKIDDALTNADLTELPADKLLDYKLKYMDTLNNEYISLPDDNEKPSDVTTNYILSSFNSLYDRIKKGEISKDQASKEILVLSNMLKAYDAVELQTKLQTLEAIVGGRA